MQSLIRFLAVDDDPAFLMVLSHMMEELGYQPPVLANSGAEALTLLADPSQRIDCVLLDIQMPHMDGIEACLRIRALRYHHETPIMMITTMKGRSFVDQAFSAGATDYLTKPLERIELSARLGMIKRLVAERRKAGALQLEMGNLSTIPELNFAFEDAKHLQDCSLVIDLLALQNYLLTLNRLSLHAHVAVGFRVVGAEQCFSRLGRLEFLDYLADIGDCITASLKRHDFKLAYAGRGEFVAIISRRQHFHGAEVEAEIAMKLSQYARIYNDFGVTLPTVVVGEPQQTGFFSARSTEILLDRALESARIETSIVARPKRWD